MRQDETKRKGAEVGQPTTKRPNVEFLLQAFGFQTLVTTQRPSSNRPRKP